MFKFSFKIKNFSGKIFKILYFLNLLIIVFGLLFPLVENVFLLKEITFKDTGLSLYGVLIILSISFCLSFLILNIWGVMLRKNKLVYGVVTAILIIWIVWGLNQWHKDVFP